MSQDFACFNSDCASVDVVRSVPFPVLAEGVYDNPTPLCGTCGWVVGAVSAPYSA